MTLTAARLRWSLLSVVLVMTLSACGSDSQADADRPLRVIVSTAHDPTMMGPEAADSLGLWAECQPKVDVEFSFGQEVSAAMAAGSVDIGVTSPNALIAAIDQGLPAKIIGPSMSAWDMYAITDRKGNFKSFRDLKGATFGITKYGSAGDYATRALAKSLDWSKDDYRIVTLGSPEGLQAGVKSGTIDGYLWGVGPAYTLEEKGVAAVLGSVKDLVGPNAMTVFAATEEALEGRPDQVRSFMECTYKAVSELQEDRGKAADLLTSWDMSPEVAEKVIEGGLPLLSRDGTFTKEMVHGMLDATHATIDGSSDITDSDVGAMIRPWTELSDQQDSQ